VKYFSRPFPTKTFTEDIIDRLITVCHNYPYFGYALGQFGIDLGDDENEGQFSSSNEDVETIFNTATEDYYYVLDQSGKLLKDCNTSTIVSYLGENTDCKLVAENSKTIRINVGTSNSSSSGPCLKWTDVYHEFINSPGIGDHNYCRNPDKNIFKQEICITDNGTAPCDVRTCGEVINQLFSSIPFNLFRPCYNNWLFK
jgi:hypothetical protein